MPSAFEGQVTATQEYDPKAEQRRDDAGKHPLIVWTGLYTGDVVSPRALGIGTISELWSRGLRTDSLFGSGMT